MDMSKLGNFKALLISLFLTGTSLGAAQSPTESFDLSIGSFNIHYISLRRPVLPWEERRTAASSAVNELDADIIAFQEMETWAGRGSRSENLQLAWMLEHSPQYDAAAIGDPEEFPSTQPIFYKEEKFEALEQGFFFFSETPDVIYSRPWDPSFSAFATWVRFRSLVNGNVFRVLNLHLDHSSKINRHAAAELTLERIEPWIEAGEATLVIGDFNALSWFKTMDIFLAKDELQIADRAGSTFHFNRGLNLYPAIDHVLYFGFEQVGDTLRLNKKYEDVWPSDHYPIRVDLNFSASN